MTPPPNSDLPSATTVDTTILTQAASISSIANPAPTATSVAAQSSTVTDHTRSTPLSRRQTYTTTTTHSRTPTISGLSLAEMTPVPTQPGSPTEETFEQELVLARSTSASTKSVPDAFILPNGYPDYLRLILTSKVYEVVQETPLTVAQNLSNRLECNVLLKREDLQPVFSFKLRGAYNKMAHLDAKDRWKGVVACSAGNHAQGVAYSARHLKIPATIVMPQGTPAIKHLNVSRLGGSVVLHGNDFDACKAEAARLSQLHGLTNIPPFDDPYVIAGQGTIGMELLRQTDLTKLEAVICTIGGGGLIAGIGAYIKRIAPHVKIIGAETFDACAMADSLSQNCRVQLREVGLFADGAAVKLVGEECFRLATEVVDEVILCTTDEICAAIKDVFEDTRSILEPAGALSVAALKKYTSLYPSEDRSRTLVAIASGANMDFDRLRFVAERAKLGEGKEALLAVTIPERPGAFAKLVAAVGPDVGVTEFRYRFSSADVSGGATAATAKDGDKKFDEAFMLMGVEFANSQVRDKELPDLMARISSTPTTPTLTPSTTAEEKADPISLSVLDCSSSELAKTHIRYLVGGRSSVPNERLFMFEFPERRGALHNFLQTLQRSQPASASTTPTTTTETPTTETAATTGMFNISLFHYRNQGGDVGRILAGIQCRPEQDAELQRFLAEIGYRFDEVTDEKVYQMFMRS